MTRRFEEFEGVRLPDGVQEYGIPPGARAVVLHVHEEPVLGYELEVFDDEGRTIFVGGIEAIYVEADRPSEG